MYESFHQTKIKIHDHVATIFRKPLSLVVKDVPEIRREKLEELVEIFWQVSGNFEAIPRRDIVTILAVFPAAVAILSPRFEEKSVEYLVEHMLKELMAVKTTKQKTSPTS